MWFLLKIQKQFVLSCQELSLCISKSHTELKILPQSSKILLNAEKNNNKLDIFYNIFGCSIPSQIMEGHLNLENERGAWVA